MIEVEIIICKISQLLANFHYYSYLFPFLPYPYSFIRQKNPLARFSNDFQIEAKIALHLSRDDIFERAVSFAVLFPYDVFNIKSYPSDPLDVFDNVPTKYDLKTVVILGSFWILKL